MNKKGESVKNKIIKMLYLEYCRHSRRRDRHKPSRISTIVAVVCIEFGTTTYQIKKKTRLRAIVEARQALCWAFKNYTKMTGYQIGKWFGTKKDHSGFDHATCLYSIKHAEALMDSDPDFREKIENIEKKLK